MSKAYIPFHFRDFTRIHQLMLEKDPLKSETA